MPRRGHVIRGRSSLLGLIESSVGWFSVSGIQIALFLFCFSIFYFHQLLLFPRNPLSFSFLCFVLQSPFVLFLSLLFLPFFLFFSPSHLHPPLLFLLLPNSSLLLRCFSILQFLLMSHLSYPRFFLLCFPLLSFLHPRLVYLFLLRFLL